MKGVLELDAAHTVDADDNPVVNYAVEGGLFGGGQHARLEGETRAREKV